MEFRHQITRPPTSVWQRERVLFKLAVLVALGYVVWAKPYTFALIVGQASAPTSAAVQTSLVGPSEGSPSGGSVVGTPPPDVAATFSTAIRSSRAECDEYVARFAPVAVAEMRKSGIPASVTLAQGLLESNAGQSKLAQKANNHFGIKCFSRRCKRGHCLNFTDDSHKDFFVKYANVWGSYRAHSAFLRGTPRYAGLFRLDPKDYRGWAYGLAKAGYATDKNYGVKLVAIVEHLGLAKYDAN
jgi:hypothetical protein